LAAGGHRRSPGVGGGEKHALSPIRPRLSRRHRGLRLDINLHLILNLLVLNSFSRFAI